MSMSRFAWKIILNSEIDTMHRKVIIKELKQTVCISNVAAI